MLRPPSLLCPQPVDARLSIIRGRLDSALVRRRFCDNHFKDEWLRAQADKSAF